MMKKLLFSTALVLLAISTATAQETELGNCGTTGHVIYNNTPVYGGSTFESEGGRVKIGTYALNLKSFPADDSSQVHIVGVVHPCEEYNYVAKSATGFVLLVDNSGNKIGWVAGAFVEFLNN